MTRTHSIRVGYGYGEAIVMVTDHLYMVELVRVRYLRTEHRGR